MIHILFTFANETILVSVDRNEVMFGNTSYGARMATIDGIDIKYSGVVKEFPDLKDRQDWREEAINRFKDKVKSLKDEKKVAEYIIKDLSKHGYTAFKIQEKGKRAITIKNSKITWHL